MTRSWLQAVANGGRKPHRGSRGPRFGKNPTGAVSPVERLEERCLLSIPAIDTIPPQIADVTPIADATGKKIAQLRLVANEGLNEAAAELLNNFGVTGAGKDKRLGTADDQPLAIAAAEYDAPTQQVTLTLAKQPKLGTFLRVFASGHAGGLVDEAGNALDGNGDGAGGDDFVTSVALGIKFKYTDADGDKVALKLTGGGTIRLIQGAGDAAPELTILNPTAGVTTLDGSVKPGRNGDGRAPIAFIVGGDAIVNRLPAATFNVGTFDTVAPAAPTGLGLTPATDSGVSANDAITNVALPVVMGNAEAGSTVRLFLNAIQVGQAISNGLWQIPVGPLTEGQHTFTATATDAAGNTSLASAPFNVTIDATPPDLPTVDLAPASDTAPLGDGRTSLGVVTLAGQTAAAMRVELLETGATTTSNGAGAFSFAGVALAEGNNRFTVRATDAAGNMSQAVRTIARVTEMNLAEGNAFVVETTVPVVLGQTQGTRTVRFDVEASFDTTDQTAAAEDMLLVYLVDPASPAQTLLDRGTPGTTLFSLAGDAVEMALGLVRYDGSTVEIDVTSLGARTTGLLLFQLVGSDSDTGSTARIGSVESLIDPAGVVGPAFPMTTETADAGPALDVATLNESGDVALQVGNVRVDSATGRYVGEFQLRNNAAAFGRQAAVVFPDLPAGVNLVNSSGTTGAGDPYVSFSNAVPPGGLGTNQLSMPIEVAFTNPGLVRFPLTANVLIGPVNRAPVFDPIGPLTVMAGGQLATAVNATDPDGDPVTVLLESVGPLPRGQLGGDGVLRFMPSAGDVGVYPFTLVASDGALQTLQNVTLNVTADPITTTRVSGVVQDSDGEPLRDVPVVQGGVQTTTGADGSFELMFPAGVGAGPLEVRADQLAGSVAFPRLHVSIVELLGHGVENGVNNVIARPILLTPVDTANLVPLVGGGVTNVATPAIPGALVIVPPGSVADPTIDMMGLTEVPLDRPPVQLPAELAPDVAVLLTPADTMLSAPASLTLPNRAGWAPGVVLDLWALDPSSGEFEDVGDGRISNDGTRAETVAGGVPGGGVLFFAPRPAQPMDPNGIVFNQDTSGREFPLTTPVTSEVEVHSGVLLETHNLVTYQSVGRTHGLTLRYDSLRADPRPIIHFGFPALDPAALAGLNADRLRLVAQMTVRRGDFEFQVPGFASAPQFGLTGNEHFWTLPDEPGEVEAAMQADLSQFPSGLYDYELTLGVRIFDDAGQRLVGSARRVTGRILHVNTIDSPLGSGWGFSDLLEIVVNPDGSALVIYGDGSELLFRPPAAPGEAFVSPAADFSRLERIDDGSGTLVFRRTLRDQTVLQFDAANRLASVRDRNGNETRYTYDAQGRLATVTDPANLQTTLTYGAGFVEITDPANRRTRLTLDAAGNLATITDPDTSRRTFGYDTLHHLTRELTERGFVEETVYGFHGRVERGVRANGAVVQGMAAQTLGLFPPEDTSVPFTAPARNLNAAAMQAGATGAIAEVLVDRFGQPISISDIIGCLARQFLLGANNLPLAIQACNGNEQVFVTDQNGNLVSSRDALSGTINVVPPDQQFGFNGPMYPAELNGDSFGDLVGTDSNRNILIYEGTGMGRFVGPTRIAEPAGVGGPGIIDANGDGTVDFFYRRSYEDVFGPPDPDDDPPGVNVVLVSFLSSRNGYVRRTSTFEIVPESADPAFREPPQVPNPPYFTTDLAAIVDLNGDGVRELITYGQGLGIGVGETGARVFSPIVVPASRNTGAILRTEQACRSGLVGDINGDGAEGLPGRSECLS
jgi:YD repeat-containing protein